MTQKVPLRKEIPAQYIWDTQSVFPSDEAWETEIKRVSEQLPALEKFKGRLGEGPQALRQWFETVEKIFRSVGKIFVYASMFHHVDTTDQAAAAKYDRARGLLAKTAAAMAFAEPEMLSVGLEKLRRWAKEDPHLTIYQHYFDELERRQKHIRSAEVEELLKQLSDPFRTAAATHGVLSDAELVFKPARSSQREEFEISQGTIGSLLSHADREVRRTAWENYGDAYLSFKNTMANCIAAGVKQNVFMARARRYASALEAALTSNFIPIEVFHSLIATYRKHIPTWHRYWKMRKRALGYDKLYVYDTRASLTQKQFKIPYTQTVDWICEGMRPLGEDYVKTMRKGLLDERWVDVYPNKGKRMGAFSSGSPGTHPFIMMSYNDDIYGLSTLAHELGHSMHSYYTWKTQPFVYARYGLFVAEVASNFNQALVREHLLKRESDPDMQINIIEEAMANFHRYFFIMPTLARFELEIHQRVERGEALTAEILIKLMAQLFSEGYGDDVEMDVERVGITWAQFATHLYSNFYVYQYATGISGAHALAEGVLTGKPGAAQKYLEFLKAGGSLFPLEVLKLAGVDLSSPEPVERTFGVLARYVERLGELTERRNR
ncbi:oligoendopeptidase F [Candidatus Acetothermia bacterium]|jgi:oligoendopeptidase F|nr:oligoendopeptidase F [Candidatus Acetothermia bacterium]MCI2432026.1 oligoendopeptidase F [Candidatus Acetothermia bacterium]MCI2436004.1 oligoendopeptidase F [Candidatus Acetothermia bacterium]